MAKFNEQRRGRDNKEPSRTPLCSETAAGVAGRGAIMQRDVTRDAAAAAAVRRAVYIHQCRASISRAAAATPPVSTTSPSTTGWRRRWRTSPAIYSLPRRVMKITSPRSLPTTRRIAFPRFSIFPDKED